MFGKTQLSTNFPPDLGNTFLLSCRNEMLRVLTQAQRSYQPLHHCGSVSLLPNYRSCGTPEV